MEAAPRSKTALPPSSVGSLGPSKTDPARRSGTQAVQVGTKSSGPISAQARQAPPPIACMRAEISGVDNAPT